MFHPLRHINFSQTLTTALLVTFTATNAQAVPVVHERLKLFSTNPQLGDSFGADVAIAGNTLLVGKPFSTPFPFIGSPEGPGAIPTFNLDSGNSLLSGPSSDGIFGNSFAVGGNTIVAAVFEPETFSGAVSFYDLATGAFRTGAAPFGTVDYNDASIAADGNIALIAPPIQNVSNPPSSLGESVFVYDLTTGTQLHELSLPDSSTGDLFGSSVAVAGDRAVISAAGRGSTFVFDLNTGGLLFELLTQQGDPLSSNVAASGTAALVGDRIFDLTSGNETFQLIDSDGNQPIGRRAIGGNLAVIGSSVFDLTTGLEIVRLAPSDAPGTSFGKSVATDGQTVVIGARQATFFDVDPNVFPFEPFNAGAVYIFDIPEPASAALLTIGGLSILRRRTS